MPNSDTEESEWVMPSTVIFFGRPPVVWQRMQALSQLPASRETFSTGPVEEGGSPRNPALLFAQVGEGKQTDGATGTDAHPIELHVVRPGGHDDRKGGMPAFRSGKQFIVADKFHPLVQRGFPQEESFHAVGALNA